MAQPNGLLRALQVYVDLLAEKFSSGSVAKQLESGGVNEIVKQAKLCSLALARVAGCRDNQDQICKGGDRLVKSVIVLVKTLLDLVSASSLYLHEYIFPLPSHPSPSLLAPNSPPVSFSALII